MNILEKISNMPIDNGLTKLFVSMDAANEKAFTKIRSKPMTGYGISFCWHIIKDY